MFESKVGAWAKSPVLSLPRAAVDVGFWVGAAAVARSVDRPWATALAVAFIGAVPMHDVLFHTHEGAHRRLARRRWLNEVASTIGHALFGMSGAGYREFHLRHHRFAHTDKDPEFLLMNRIAKGAPGWAWLAMPLAAIWPTTVAPLAVRGALRRRVARDVAVIFALHAALAAALGVAGWATWILAPMLTSLALVVTIRSLCEHHGTRAGDRWTNVRGMEVGALLGFLWSNASYHAEHHLFPSVPFQHLPKVRRMLRDAYVEHGTPIEAGYVRTGLRLLAAREHFVASVPKVRAGRPLVDRASLAYRMRVAMFRDVLRSAEARKHLFRVYYTGEAYTELHPDGVFIERLGPELARRLERHLADETRHATVFRSFLARDGAEPRLVPALEDVGWNGLNHAVPEVVAGGASGARLGRDETMEYMAFLHALELRSTGDLLAVIDAADQIGDGELADALRGILRDERGHAAYTHRAVVGLAVSRGEARRTFERMARRERRAYAQSVRAITAHLGALGAAPDALVDRARWLLLRLMLKTGLASPKLPVYERIEARLFA